MQVTCILEQSTYKPGDQAPEGYLAWHEWAETQHKAGLRQKECGRCAKWKYPQELSAQIDECVMQSRKGPVTLKAHVCHKCAAPNAVVSGQPPTKETAMTTTPEAGPMDLPVMPLERLMALVDAHVDDARLHCNGLAARSEVAASRVKLNDALSELIYPCCDLLAHCDENPPMGDSLWSVRQIRAALGHNAI